MRTLSPSLTAYSNLQFSILECYYVQHGMALKKEFNFVIAATAVLAALSNKIDTTVMTYTSDT